MKHQPGKLLTYWLQGLLCTLIVMSCQKANDATPALPCKMTHQVASATSSSGGYTSDIVYNFDAGGRFVSQTYQTTNTPKTGNKSSSLSKQTLVYDADGFLMSQSSTYERTESGKTSIQSGNKTTNTAMDG